MERFNVPLSELKQMLPGKLIFVRCNDARFIITKSAFRGTIKALKVTPTFDIDVNERFILIESVNQNR